MRRLGSKLGRVGATIEKRIALGEPADVQRRDTSAPLRGKVRMPSPPGRYSALDQVSQRAVEDGRVRRLAKEGRRSVRHVGSDPGHLLCSAASSVVGDSSGRRSWRRARSRAMVTPTSGMPRPEEAPARWRPSRGRRRGSARISRRTLDRRAARGAARKGRGAGAPAPNETKSRGLVPRPTPGRRARLRQDDPTGELRRAFECPGRPCEGSSAFDEGRAAGGARASAATCRVRLFDPLG